LVQRLTVLAISTLLQPPIVRTGLLPYTSAPALSVHKAPTIRDIPPVTLTNIPTVDATEFDPYISQVGALYEALQKAKDNEEDGGTQLLRRSSKLDGLADILETEAPSGRPDVSRQSSWSSVASIEPPSPRKRSLSSSGRRLVQAPTPLSTVPNVYFDENFHLENPRTFDIVSERSDVVRPVAGAPDERTGANGTTPAPRKALATNAILQEKLSWYMDTVEVHLISSISTASSSFFAALGSLKDLHSEAAESVSRIKALRRELRALDKEMAAGGLEIVSQRRRRENLKQLSDAVQQLKLVAESIRQCESLVESGEVEKALDAIDSLERLIAGEESETNCNGIVIRDLRGATALQDTGDSLGAMRFRIGKTFESRLLNTLLGDLRSHVETTSTSDILLRWSNSSQRARGGHNREPSVFPTYLAVSEEFRSLLLSNLSGLYRAQHTSPAATAFRDSVLREVRNIVRRSLPSSNDDDADSMMSASTVGGGRNKSQHEKSSILARNLRAMDPEDAEEMLKKIYIAVGETLRRAGTQAKVLLDVTSTLGDPVSPTSSIGSPALRTPNTPTPAVEGRMAAAPLKGVSGRDLQEELHQTLDMANLLGQAVDTAQDKVVKVLRVRSEQSTHLSVERFLRYFTLNLLFANECEAVSGRSGTPLKNVVNGHIKDFAQHLSESERQSLASCMESDTWNATDFTDSDKEYLTRILSASTEDAKAWSEGGKVWLPASSAPDTLLTTSNGTLPLPGSQVNGKSASGVSTPTPSPSPSRSVVRPAIIESESFLLTVSAVSCMRGLSSFLHLMTGLPSLAPDVSTSIISYLTLFNSRCTQLILGAGATRSAGLKNITTKHLALAAQALSFISTLIPHVREFVRRHAGSGASVSSTMGEFDRIRRAYLEHQQSIYDKLVDIMAGRATVHAKAMKTINWEKDGKSVNSYMEILTKETNTLHKVLTKHLPESTIRMIMQPVFKSYREQWGKAFGEVALLSEEGQQRYVQQLSHYYTALTWK
jgi:vacuolar protein sorting-associated protein 54